MKGIINIFFHLLFLSLSCVILKVRHNETVLEKRKYFIAYSLIQVQNLISFYKILRSRMIMW